eukprot:Rhum_TRINITY_DN15633_c0_g1::Rhum_TRINITY_DN15633_c0_g1_i1::g.161722::m.161722
MLRRCSVVLCRGAPRARQLDLDEPPPKPKLRNKDEGKQEPTTLVQEFYSTLGLENKGVRRFIGMWASGCIILTLMALFDMKRDKTVAKLTSINREREVLQLRSNRREDVDAADAERQRVRGEKEELKRRLSAEHYERIRQKSQEMEAMAKRS